MHTESRSFIVVFSDNSNKTLQGTCVELIMLKTLTYLVGLKKDYTIKAIIDEANAQIYGDFSWDFSYSQKDKEWLQESPPVYSSMDMKSITKRFAKYLDVLGICEYREALIDDWLNKHL